MELQLQLQSITTKYATLADIPRIIKEAFYIASTGRPGPVLIDFPKGYRFRYLRNPVQVAEVNLPGYQPTIQPNYLQIRKLTEAVSRAKKPVILAGAGILHSNAPAELKEYAAATKNSSCSYIVRPRRYFLQTMNYLSDLVECMDVTPQIWPVRM